MARLATCSTVQTLAYWHCISPCCWFNPTDTASLTSHCFSHWRCVPHTDSTSSRKQLSTESLTHCCAGSLKSSLALTHYLALIASLAVDLALIASLAHLFDHTSTVCSRQLAVSRQSHEFILNSSLRCNLLHCPHRSIIFTIRYSKHTVSGQSEAGNMTFSYIAHVAVLL